MIEVYFLIKSLYHFMGIYCEKKGHSKEFWSINFTFYVSVYFIAVFLLCMYWHLLLLFLFSISCRIVWYAYSCQSVGLFRVIAVITLSTRWFKYDRD